MKPSERVNEAYDQKFNLGASEGMKPSEYKNEAYDQNSILEWAKE